MNGADCRSGRLGFQRGSRAHNPELVRPDSLALAGRRRRAEARTSVDDVLVVGGKRAIGARLTGSRDDRSLRA
jgi:hypothetical protein